MAFSLYEATLLNIAPFQIGSLPLSSMALACGFVLASFLWHHLVFLHFNLLFIFIIFFYNNVVTLFFHNSHHSSTYHMVTVTSFLFLLFSNFLLLFFILIAPFIHEYESICSFITSEFYLFFINICFYICLGTYINCMFYVSVPICI